MTKKREAAAALLQAAHQRREPYVPLAGDLLPATLEEAYAVQEAFCDLLCTATGDHIAGHKIALTSPAMQAMCGIDHPLAGMILSSRVHSSPATIDYGTFQHVGVECEIAVRLARDLDGRGGQLIRSQIADAVAAYYPAFELIEDRNADYAALDAASLIADNCWNGGNVIGDQLDDAIDFATATARLRINGEIADEGKTDAAMGHPLDVVAWLATLLGQRGTVLEKDAIIMTGSVVTTKFPAAGDEILLEIEGATARLLFATD